MSIINPYTVIATFALFLIIFAFWKPQVSRIVLGVFFLIMALGVNLPFILTDPNMFVEAGRNALLLTPVGKEELTSPLMAIAPAIMTRKRFDLTLWDLAKEMLKKKG